MGHIPPTSGRGHRNRCISLVHAHAAILPTPALEFAIVKHELKRSAESMHELEWERREGERAL